MKKSKLFLSLLSMCFALAVLCFGVYAANQVNYSISGNITYTVEDCYVEVNTKVYTLGTRQYYADLHHIVDATYPSLSESNITIELEDESNLTLTYAGKTSTTYDSRVSNEYTNTTDFDSLSYSTGSGGVYAYIFVINVQNLSSDVNVWAVVDDYTIPANTIYTTNYSQQIIGEYTQDEPSNKNIVFAMGLDDPTASIPNANKAFNISLEIGSGNYATSDYIKSKLTIEDGVASAKDANISGVVVIPNGVTELAESGFLGCENIIDVYVPISVETIGERVFSGCIKLITLNLPFTGGDLPSKIEYDHISLYFEDYDYEDDEYLPTGTYVYATDCDRGYVPLSLKNVSFVYGCTEIPYGAFYATSYRYNAPYDVFIENIFIPSSVTTIDDCALEAVGLEYLDIPYGVTSIYGLASNDFKSIFIPSSVISIGYGAFYECRNLELVTISSGVTTIGDSAFFSCSNLTSIVIPDSVNMIWGSPFTRCTKLISIIVDEDNETYTSRDSNGNECNCIMTIDGETLVDGCNTTVIPTSVITINSYAFYGSGLAIATIPDSVTTIGEYAFSDCKFLTSITIPSSITSVDFHMIFSNCTSLTSIVVDEDNENYTSRDSNGDECNCIMTIDGETLILGCKNTIIPTSVTEIATSAFSNCAGLATVIIPDSVTLIDTYAFQGCTGLTSIEIPSSVITIWGSAFCDCTGLTTVTISSGVTSIGFYAFQGCTSLTSITINRSTPPSLSGNDSFDNTNDCPIYVPSASVNAYKSASGWSEYASRIQAIVE